MFLCVLDKLLLCVDIVSGICIYNNGVILKVTKMLCYIIMFM